MLSYIYKSCFIGGWILGFQASTSSACLLLCFSQPSSLFTSYLLFHLSFSFLRAFLPVLTAQMGAPLLMPWTPLYFSVCVSYCSRSRQKLKTQNKQNKPRSECFLLFGRSAHPSLPKFPIFPSVCRHGNMVAIDAILLPHLLVEICICIRGSMYARPPRLCSFAL